MRKNLTLKGLFPLVFLLAAIIANAQDERLSVRNEEKDARKSQASKPISINQKPQKVIQRLATSKLGLPLETDIRGNNNNGTTGTANFTQSETSIVAFGNNVVIGFNDAGSAAGGANHFTGWTYSSDGGATFTDGGVLPASAGGDAGDPVLARNNTTGRIYFSTLGFNVGTIQMWRSDNNGVSWLPPVNATPGGASEDKQWHAVDNFAGAGNGNVYLISRNFGAGNGIYMYRSLDNGASFGPTGGVLIASGAGGNVQGAYVAVGPDHSVYAFYFDDGTNQIKMRRSTDLGLTYGASVIVATGLIGGINGDLALTGQRQGTATFNPFRSNEFPHVVINPVSGHLYATFANNPAGADKADVYLVQSTDNGATWGAPIRVNDDATETDQWQPTIAMMPDGLQVGVFYYSRQEDAGNNLFKYYGRIARINGATINWMPSFAVSDVASLPEFGRDAVVNTTYMGDYDHTVTTPGIFHVVWADNRDDLPGGAPRKDPSVYYEKILSPSTVPGKNINVVPTTINFGQVAVGQPAPQAQIVISNTGDQPLTISSITAPGGDFSLTSLPALPAVIPVNDFIIIYAQFTPATAGLKSASFNINSDAINTPSVLVNLQGEGVPPPANDACVNAIAVSCASSVTGSTNFAAADAAPTCNAVTNTGKGVWYSIAGTGYPITASLCTGTSFDSKLSVYSGSCAALVCVGANDNFCGSQSQVTWSSVVGTTYYILVHGTTSGNFTLNITCPPLITVTPSPLVINVPYGGTGSGVLNIANAAGSADLNWAINDLNQPYVAKTSNDVGGPVFNWTDITGTGTALVLGDDANTSLPLPFTFSFFGEDKTTVFVASNGFLSFRNQGNNTFTNTTIPATTNPNDLVAGFWDDLNPSLPGGGTIHYLSSATRFVVQFTNIRPFSGTGAYTFQMILNADGTIVYQYLNMTGAVNSATIGIENVDGTKGVQTAFNQAFVTNNLAVRYSIRPLSECSWITSINPFVGTTPGGTSTASTIGVDATALNCGTYNCEVKVSSNAANTPVVMVPVILNVQAQFTCSIVSVPSNNVYTGGVPTNIYLGYGPQSTTLQSTVTGPGGPFTYSWSPATGLSSTTSAAPVFTPTAPGTYVFTLTVTGAGGCPTTCSITINVYDIRVPGTNGKKIYLCHVPPDNPNNPHTLQVSTNAVPGHMPAHTGDRLGSCDLMIAPRMRVPDDVVSTSQGVITFPNPNKGNFSLQLNNYKAGRVEVRIVNANGVLVERRTVNINGKGQTIQFNLKREAGGLYYVQIVGADGTQTSKFVISR